MHVTTHFATIFCLAWTLTRALPVWGAGESTTRPTTQHTDADYANRVRALRAVLPDDFTIVVERPFVVIGDEPADVVRRRAQQTVGWAVEHLKRAYFARDPDRILNIWLFKDARSYEANALKLFGDKPDTPYGYYSPSNDALVMNIATGGGTLVHEIVHPFIEANFPDCPAWFNEGLGSLYEQSAERHGNIVGLPNWRLRGLKQAIEGGNLLSFSALAGMSTSEFYDDKSGRNYAQARYLCFYLQENGLLQRFYARFASEVASDPTGYKSLQDVLGESDIAEHEAEFRKFVLGLRFP